MDKRIDPIIIDRILDTARIEEVVGDFIDLHKRGVRYLGLCPFHDDRHLGSFVVYPKGNCFKCFKCDAKGGVVDFLMKHEKLSYPDAIRWLGKKYNIDTDMEDFNYTPPPPRPKPAPLPTLTLPIELVMAREDIVNGNLVQWIRHGVNWDSVQRKRVDEILHDYHIGLSKQGHSIFWQIDEKKRVRTGKMMKYRPDGHRDKEASWNFDFVHSTLCRKKNDSDPWPFPNLYNPDRQEMRMTLFGMHLLDHYKRFGIEQTVCIVESEKTAILMAIAYGNNARQVWMACGGMMNLTYERLRPIIAQHRPIMLYPDRDGIDRWRERCELLHYDKVTIDTTPVTKWWLPEDGDKADIADVVIRSINGSNWHPSTIDDVTQTLPQTKPLINKLNLEIVNERKSAEQ